MSKSITGIVLRELKENDYCSGVYLKAILQAEGYFDMTEVGVNNAILRLRKKNHRIDIKTNYSLIKRRNKKDE